METFCRQPASLCLAGAEKVCMKSGPILFALLLASGLGAACAASSGNAAPAGSAPGAAAASVTGDRAAWAGRVRGEFLHAWRAYEGIAWGRGELLPVPPQGPAQG